jgi:F-type H+-transporting ATPase subunit b
MKNFCFALSITFIFNANHVFGAEVGMPQLNPEYWAAQIFWLILIFSGLYLIIWKIFFPRITDSIENRKSKVINDLAETQKIKENAEKKLNEYNEIIENVKKEARKMIENSKKKLENDIKSKKQKFNEEIEKELLNVEKEIKSLKKSSISSINKIAVETSAEMIRKIVGGDVNLSNVSDIIEDISKKKMEKNI